MTIQGGAHKIANLLHNSNFARTCGRYIEVANDVINQLITGGGTTLYDLFKTYSNYVMSILKLICYHSYAKHMTSYCFHMNYSLWNIQETMENHHVQ